MSEFQPTLPTEGLTSVTAWLAPYRGGFPQLLQNPGYTQNPLNELY
jgi:hypothetical protein